MIQAEILGVRCAPGGHKDLVGITLLSRDDEINKSLLAEIHRNLVTADLARTDDVFVMITEIGSANISFGGGLAQRAVDVPTR